METIRIGIVGAGGIVRSRHMPGLSEIEGVQVTAVCNSTVKSGEAFAAEYGIPRVYEEYTELVTSDEVDAVLIGTPPYMHRPVTLAALEAGKHVFCQARMAMNAKEAAEMVRAQERTGLVGMVCPAPVGLTGDRHMQALLQEGYVGEVYSIRACECTDSWADPETEFHWRLDRSKSGVNTLAVGLYVEWVHRWFGPTARISAHIEHCITERRDPASGEMRHVDTPDIVLVHGRMASGAAVSYEFNGVRWGAEEKWIEVNGSLGSLRYLRGKDEIVGARNGEGPAVIPTPEYLVRRWDVERIWIDAIRKGTPVSPSFQDGLRYMDVTEAVYRSVRTGCAVDLPLSDETRNTPAF